MERVYLGLGTNLGDRKANLRDALRRLQRVLSIDAVSSVYESEPVGYTAQPRFWNLVVRAATDLEPEALLDRIQAIERRMGRRRPFRNAPRVIDIDVLLYGDRTVRADALEIPHPRMLDRAFVLRPLVELDPEVMDPRTGRRIAERLEAAGPFERVERLFDGSELRDGVDEEA